MHQLELIKSYIKKNTNLFRFLFTLNLRWLLYSIKFIQSGHRLGLLPIDLISN